MTIRVDPDWWKSLFDDVYLQEVIATAQRTHLRPAPFLGAGAHSAGIGAG